MTVYTIEHAYLMWEVVAVSRHNEYLANKYYRDKAK